MSAVVAVQQANARQAALEWVHRGFHPIPIPARRKKPALAGWPELRINESGIPKYFGGGPQNIGILLGDDYGSADLDCDCPEAIAAARQLAPETGLIFGRASAPFSHWFYRCDPPTRTRTFKDPNDGRVLLEIRCQKTDGTVGMQTVVPPSLHEETGEQIRFESGFDRQPANIEADALLRAASRIAAAALLARHWPEAGNGRHECEMALAGVLARTGWHQHEAERFLLATYTSVSTHDRTKIDRVRRAVTDTFEKVGSDRNVYGIPTLRQHIDDRTVRAVLSWLDIDIQQSDNKSEAKPRPRVIHDAGAWHSRLIINERTLVPRALLANAVLALHEAPEIRGALAFNDFSLDIVAERPTPWGTAGRWSDNDNTQAAVWLQREHGIHVNSGTAAEAALTVARARSFHPVRAYLDSLSWDRTQRIDQWLSLYLGTENNEYTRAVGQRWLISAVARIYTPGAKADCCLILEGPQGLKKSTALRTIAGDWFTDELADLGSKDAAMQTRGVWIIEIAELDTLHRSDVGRIKAFMSRTRDRFRPPYGRTLVESPRQCVFAGSVNQSTYLRDETGGRRFWPVTCTRILIDELARDRDQLWAEAVTRYREGAVWWLDTPELNRLAEQAQADRYEGDPWEEPIAQWVQSPQRRHDASGHPIAPFSSDSDSVTITDILLHCIGKRTDQLLQADKNRVARCLVSLKFKRYQAGTRERREWRYRRA